MFVFGTNLTGAQSTGLKSIFINVSLLFLECNIFKTYAQSASLYMQLHINTAHAQCFCTQDNSLQNKYTYLFHFTKYHHRGKHIITQEQLAKGCLTVQFKARLKRSTQCLKLLNECLSLLCNDTAALSNVYLFL